MAYNKEEAGNWVIRLLDEKGLRPDPETCNTLRRTRKVKLLGYDCMTANVWSSTSQNIKVCKSWFRDNQSNEMPQLRYGRSEFQLIPTDGGLFALYYLALKDYALKLERERSKWFDEETWGIVINPEKGTFRWRGGNTKDFPMTPLCHLQSLHLRKLQYHSRKVIQ
jgi:hypothetical protein